MDCKIDQADPKTDQLLCSLVMGNHVYLFTLNFNTCAQTGT